MWLQSPRWALPGRCLNFQAQGGQDRALCFSWVLTEDATFPKGVARQGLDLASTPLHALLGHALMS